MPRAQPNPSPAASTRRPWLDIAIESWAVNMRARNKKKRSIAAFRQVVTAAKRAEGWTEPEHLSYEAVVGYPGPQEDRGPVAGPDVQPQPLVLPLAHEAHEAGRRIAEDPLADADRAEDDGGDGSRAATLEEARAMIREAWARGITDRRAGATGPCTGCASSVTAAG